MTGALKGFLHAQTNPCEIATQFMKKVFNTFFIRRIRSCHSKTMNHTKYTQERRIQFWQLII